MKMRLFGEKEIYYLHLVDGVAFLDDTVQSSRLTEIRDLKVGLKECFCLRMVELATVVIIATI